ncbi:hypothetical protein [Pleomorphomonas sp. NRK KF1]|uniref:hypothetical protein n=1 Tax=Pleomorphomonas sp. NRK KF1 TaxID=2943000 RepID=UPI00204438DA|nr:hypothetical protein [Pleomorphomonas sp. NRK KF1]MCM5552355.1 hypothetical protein [Pleomorphomonas sp. NRK KF1]
MTARLQELEDEYRDYLIESGDAPKDILRFTAQDFVSRNQERADAEGRLGGDRCDPRITEMAALIGYQA